MKNLLLLDSKSPMEEKYTHFVQNLCNAQTDRSENRQSKYILDRHQSLNRFRHVLAARMKLASFNLAETFEVLARWLELKVGQIDRRTRLQCYVKCEQLL